MPDARPRRLRVSAVHGDSGNVGEHAFGRALTAAKVTCYRWTHMLWQGRAWSVFGASLLATLCAGRALHAQCVDEALKEELIGGRHYRGVQDRLFTKALRHEISPMAGWYAGDLYA